jgi:hypothetical protein
MEKRDCRHCAYAGRVRDGRRVLLICVNCPGRLGQLTCVAPDGICRSFRARRKRASRRAHRGPTGDDVCFIALTKGKFGMVEARDFKWVRRLRWCASFSMCKYYIVRSRDYQRIFLHREIMQPPKGMVVDHIDGNGMNDCRKNMRVCTILENGHNSRPCGHSSRFKGVAYIEALRKWQAGIFIGRRVVPIGCFATELEAAHAYDRRARAEFGIHAYLNFPDEYPPPDRSRRRRASGRRSKK